MENKDPRACWNCPYPERGRCDGCFAPVEKPKLLGTEVKPGLFTEPTENVYKAPVMDEPVRDYRLIPPPPKPKENEDSCEKILSDVMKILDKFYSYPAHNVHWREIKTRYTKLQVNKFAATTKICGELSPPLQDPGLPIRQLICIGEPKHGDKHRGDEQSGNRTWLDGARWD